jgi:hypothetical protein
MKKHEGFRAGTVKAVGLALVGVTPVPVRTEVTIMLRKMALGVLVCVGLMACARRGEEPEATFTRAGETEQPAETNAHSEVEPTIASGDGCTQGSPAVVELRGTLVASERFGPPGWGETPQEDERIRVPFLLLDRPITMCSTDQMVLPGEAPWKVDSVQLNFTRVTNEPMRWLGEPITASGKISRAETGYHFGKVYMMVEQVRPSNQ